MVFNFLYVSIAQFLYGLYPVERDTTNHTGNPMLEPTEAIADVHSHDDETPRIITRRDMLSRSVVLAGMVMSGNMAAAFAQAALPSTSVQIMGPFYPVSRLADDDSDLTLIKGHKDRAAGQIIYLAGKVTDKTGKPVPNATLEIWQANAAGRYLHSADNSKAPLDANFQGYARITTGADGTYQCKTIKPGAYPTGDGDWSRPPHIHFDVRGRHSRIVTQMYFEGEPLNDKDRLLQSAGNKKGLIARMGGPVGKQERDALSAQWDVVLQVG